MQESNKRDSEDLIIMKRIQGTMWRTGAHRHVYIYTFTLFLFYAQGSGGGKSLGNHLTHTFS